jgi:aspartate kinase
MNVLKFGGTSIGTAERFKAVAKLVCNGEKKIVVLSAMSGTTNSLVEIANKLYTKHNDSAIELIDKLEKNYSKVVDELYTDKEIKQKGFELIKYHFDFIRSFTQDLFTTHEERAVLAQGELISTALFHSYLTEQNIETVLLPALNFMRIDTNSEPDNYYIKENLNRELVQHKDCNLFITQGYICRNLYGEIDNLKRGGSDYTASLIGVAVDADEIQIWTDVDGFHFNDPRYVDDTHPIPQLSFDEAAELAYFGAKILHPSSVFPAKQSNIPVRLKNTINPNESGTIITSEAKGKGIKAIAAKDGITAVKIKSGRMLLAYGFIRKVFEVFERYKTPIDMITTSEIAVSVTIDNKTHLDKVVEELKSYGVVEINEQMTIICLVGHNIIEQKGYINKVFVALKDFSIRMISYGGSRHNISVLVNSDDKKEALIALNKLFR